MIRNPQLPPKIGYVEVEQSDGTRTYRNINTGRLIGEDHEPIDLERAQQDITDLQLADIERGQEITDILLGGVQNA